MKRVLISLTLTLALAESAPAQTWPTPVATVTYETTRLSDSNHTQPARWYTPGATEPRPLLVALHTWSGDYNQSSSAPYAQWCFDHGWVFIHPNFRGVNNKPEATGSDLVVKDIIKAVEYARTHAAVDDARIYLVGVSGGGHASLLLAGKAPALWTAVSAWASISNLVDWYYDSIELGNVTTYAKNIKDSVGGEPSPGSPAEAEAQRRSPIFYLLNAQEVPLDINAGIHDGHGGYSVPIDHALNAFNFLANPEDQIPAADMVFMVTSETIPAGYPAPPVDPLYGAKSVLLRRSSNLTRVTIFNGVHEIIFTPALTWLSGWTRTRRSLPPVAAASPTPTPIPTPTPPAPYERQPNLAIPDDSPQGTLDRLVVSATGTLSSLSLLVQVDHPWVGDLSLILTHEPSGKSVLLVDRLGSPEVSEMGVWAKGLSATFSDSGAPLDAWEHFDQPIAGTVQPIQPLSDLAGTLLAGTWSLIAVDHNWGDRGTLVRWELLPTLVAPTATPTDTPTATPTPSPTPSPTATATPSPTATRTPLPAAVFDLNQDGRVDAADLLIFLSQGADFDGDGASDSRDLLRFADHWEEPATPPGTN